VKKYCKGNLKENPGKGIEIEFEIEQLLISQFYNFIIIKLSYLLYNGSVT